MNTKLMTIGVLALALALAAASAAAQSGSSVQALKAPPAPPAASQPDGAVEAPIAPSVIKAGPGVEPVQSSAVEVTAPDPAAKADKPAPGAAPAMPTADEIADELARESALPGQAGRVRSAADVAGGMPIDQPNVAVRKTQPNRESTAETIEPGKGGLGQGLKLLPDGTVIPERSGKVVRDRGRWLFVFDSDRTGTTDPPLILLPNSLLQVALSLSAFGTNNIKLRVTGEITQYQQANFLLLRKVVVEKNFDRF